MPGNSSKYMFQIANIDRLRIRTDGEGIRTLIVVYGCDLRCRYCINPHTWNGEGKIQSLTPKQLYGKISLDRPYFMATNGGVTFGGGEPLKYADEIRAFREFSGNDFTLFVETSLYVPEKEILIAADCVDRFIVDIKTTDADKYRTYTGGDLRFPLRNIERLLELVGNERIEVRIPVIPGLTTEQEQHASKELLKMKGIIHFDLFQYIISKESS